ncbi:hypothetical protein DL767_011464 [Monosporascus sp. MG133]|nr:hypothetical protein DL767_011464 [Monosporascus sp. MG133]
MAPLSGENEKGKFLGYVGDIPCYSRNLRGSRLSDLNSNWLLWNANKKEEVLTRMDCRHKVILWFTVGENLREEHFVDMGGRDKSSDDVFRRLYERVAPPGTPYEPLPPLLKKLTADEKAE